MDTWDHFDDIQILDNPETTAVEVARKRGSETIIGTNKIPKWVNKLGSPNKAPY